MDPSPEIRLFHPVVQSWFTNQLGSPSAPQKKAWPLIKEKKDCLIAAPTGSGKTLAAFLSAIDELLRKGLEQRLLDQTYVLYVSPLKALGNDIGKNLQSPLNGIRDGLLETGLPDVNIRVGVRSGDTATKDREAMRRQPPHILVTTPESLYLLLSSQSGRKMLRTVETVILDEIHAMVNNKRGVHLALSLERLQALTEKPLSRIGLSATQRPIEKIAQYLIGNRPHGHCEIVNAGHVRDRDIALELPASPLEALASSEHWSEIYDRLTELIETHGTTLIFVNTRRWAERLAHHLSERLGVENITSHHGSLSKEHRLDAETRLKSGQLKALVATASLELGIDIGEVDLVCQISSPRAISVFLQRVGRSGHAINGIPKGRLFPLTRDDLVECTALIHAVHEGDLDTLIFPEKSLDVLAQHIVAEVSCGECEEEELFELVTRAYPYRDLGRDEYQSILDMLAQGYSTRRGRLRDYIHHDGVNKKLRARKGANLASLTSGGTIPDNGDYDVLLEPGNFKIGTVNEDFAIESLAGDIFQLGNSSYRVLKLETTVMRVEDAKGLPPSIPFWIGEAPGRTHELSLAISDMKNKLTQHFSQQDWSGAKQWCRQELGLNYSASEQLVDYLATGYASFDALPTHSTLIMERFFDEAGDMHLVIHSPFGSRMNRAWGLALRKRFCRKFNFELQAAATEDAIILSLGATHSFPLIEVSHYLNRQTVRDILVQALLDAPMFKIRWRWNASIALAVLRFRGGKRIPPQLQRMDAEDLVSVIFPDQLACLENIAGDREVPDHPLVKQTIQDCLHEAMDIEALEELLLKMKEGQIRVIAQDLVEPSILAREILTAQPYAFLDDAPAEERRTRAVMARRWVSPQSASELGSLDPAAIDKVIKEAWPQCNTVDELHDALMILGSFTPLELANTGQGYELMAALVEQGRALRIEFGNENRSEAWIATERLCQWQSVHPALNQSSPVEIPDRYRKTWPEDEAIREIVRSRLSGLGPVRTEQLAQCLAVEENKILQALLYLEGEGYAMRGCFTPATQVEEWCDRTLLARIHRYTLNSLRREIEPVSAQDFMRFLFYWQGLDENTIRQGESGLLAVLSQLEGYEAAAAAWEGKILKLRIENYSPDMLDRLSMSGRIGWQRRTVSSAVKGGILKQSSICFVERKNMGLWRVEDDTLAEGDLSSLSALVYKNLVDKGALFFADLVEVCGLLEMQVEEALEDLSSKGMVSSDSFAGVRVMIRSKKTLRRRNRRAMVSTMDDAGRWVPLKPLSSTSLWTQEKIDHIAMVLLKRYGVVFKRVIERESHLPPWRELLLCYRRMESKGLVRGGRFVSGFSGEQFAHMDAVGTLRKIRKEAPSESYYVIGSADPLNLHGIITPGERVAIASGNKLLYQNGVAIAAEIKSRIEFFAELPPQAQLICRQHLLGKMTNLGMRYGGQSGLEKINAPITTH